VIALLTWADRGPFAAALSAAGLFLIGLVLPLPPIFAISAMVVAFATLRAGASAAVTAIGLAFVIALCVVFFAGLPATAVTIMAPVCWIPAAVAAGTLRQTHSLPASICVIALSGLGAVIAILAFHPMMEGFWQDGIERIRPLLTPPVIEGGTEAVPAVQFTDAQIVAFMQGGTAVTVVVMVAITGLFLARSGQAKMFNPGGFQREFHALFFGKQVAGITLAAMLVGFLIGKALGLAMVIMALFVMTLQGLAVLHALVKERSLGGGWLVGVYVLLMFFQPVLVLIAGLGLVDNFRRFPRH